MWNNTAATSSSIFIWKIPFTLATVARGGIPAVAEVRVVMVVVAVGGEAIEGAEVLAETLLAISPPRPLVVLLGVLGDKDWRGIMRALARVGDAVVLTRPPSAPDSRVWDVDEALAFARTLSWRVVGERDFGRALRLADELGSTTLITGSFHTVGDAMLRLQVNPLAG